MHQHARMFGYRLRTLAYTRLFVPRRLYYRFRDIHHSDRDLRGYIERQGSIPATFPIEFTFDLRTTRPGVLNVNTTDTLLPGKQIYPNYVIVPQNTASYARVQTKLRAHFGDTLSEMNNNGRVGVLVPVDEAVELVKLIKTRSQSTWRDATIDAVIERVAHEFGDQVLLKFRTAKRGIMDEGFMSTGTISGAEDKAAKVANVPTLWIMEVE